MGDHLLDLAAALVHRLEVDGLDEPADAIVALIARIERAEADADRLAKSLDLFTEGWTARTEPRKATEALRLHDEAVANR